MSAVCGVAWPWCGVVVRDGTASPRARKSQDGSRGALHRPTPLYGAKRWAGLQQRMPLICELVRAARGASLVAPHIPGTLTTRDRSSRNVDSVAEDTTSCGSPPAGDGPLDAAGVNCSCKKRPTRDELPLCTVLALPKSSTTDMTCGMCSARLAAAPSRAARHSQYASSCRHASVLPAPLSPLTTNAELRPCWVSANKAASASANGCAAARSAPGVVFGWSR